MTYLTRIPRPPLSDFVDLIWLYDGYAQPHAKERVLPSGEMQLLIGLLDEDLRIYDRRDTARSRSFGHALLTGAQSEYVVVDTAQQRSIMGVHFRPGGAFPFLRMPAGELQDEIVPLDAVWGAEAARLREQVLEASSHSERLAAAERCLARQFVAPPKHHATVDFAMQQFLHAPYAGISEVTAKIGLSAGRFIRLFRDEVGLTPKIFCRIRRFQTVLQRIEACRDVEWTSVALDCGYYDQSHFIHDFRAFSGLNPSTYAAHRTPHINHVPLLD